MTKNQTSRGCPEFKETEIEKIPKEWEIRSLENIVEINKESLDPSRQIPNDKFLYIDIESIDGETGVIKTVNEIFGKDAPSRARRVVHENDVIMSTVRPYLKAFAIVPKEYDGQICSTGFAVLSCKREIIPHYLLYTLFSKIVIDQCNRMMVGGQYPALNQSQVLKIKIPLPPLPEQRRIAEILSTVDDAIQKVDEAIARTERLKRGLMQRLLTRGIGHREFKDTEIGRIPKEWEVVKVGDIVEIHDSKRIPLSEMERSNRKGPYPYCGANGIIDYIDDYIFDGEFVLLAEDGGAYGKFENTAYIMSGKFWVNNHAHILQAIQGKTANRFILFIFNFLDLNPYIVGSTRKKLNQEQMRAIKIPLPPLPEQRRIAETLNTVDEKIEKEKQRKAHFEKLKKGLMQDLLTGRKRVRIGPETGGGKK